MESNDSTNTDAGADVEPSDNPPDNSEQARSRWSRRSFVVGGAATAGAIGVGYGGWRWFTAGPATFDSETLTQAGTLPIPPLLEDEGDGLALVASASSTAFVNEVSSPTWGFNQAFLGPTIRVRQGQTVPISVTNELDEAITAHWHGLHIPGDIDGGPFNLIESGERWDLTMDIAQQASTNWYHSHVHGRTGQHVYMGLAGMFIIDDENSDALNLPSTYGVDDIPLILQDRTFLADGSMYTDIGRNVFLGETVVVNGAVAPVADLQAKRIRFRLLNGANGRLFDLTMSDGTPLIKVATEGGFLNSPVEIESAFLTPGERMEVVVDLSNHQVGDEVVLRSRNVNGDGGMEDEFDALVIRIVEPTIADAELPATMNGVPLASELLASEQIVAERSFVLRMNAINGDAFDHSVVNHVSERGTWERWTVSGGAHPFHVHGGSFLVISRNGNAVSPEDAGWRDTVLVGQGTELLVRFDHEALPEATYMYHCHLMGHEDAGMMGQFVVANDPSTVQTALGVTGSGNDESASATLQSPDGLDWYCDLNDAT